MAWHSEKDKVLKSFSYSFLAEGKLITKTYTSQNKLQFFFKLKECAKLTVNCSGNCVNNLCTRVLFQSEEVSIYKLHFNVYLLLFNCDDTLFEKNHDLVISLKYIL